MLLFARVGQQLDDPLFNRRTNEAVQRTLITHSPIVKNLAQAAEDAGLGVGERSVEVEDQRWQHDGHTQSFAERRSTLQTLAIETVMIVALPFVPHRGKAKLIPAHPQVRLAFRN